MNSFWRIFSLEFTAFARSKALALLLLASVAWMFVAPRLFTGDGTAEAAREMSLFYSLGGVTALLSVSLLAAATGALARERAAKRLQLTMVRPVRFITLALAKTAALTAAGAIVLAAAATVEALRRDLSRPCRHVLAPVLPSPREEAEAMYASYINDPKTPPAVKKARKSVVLRLLEQRAFDRYETVATNAAAAWRFRLPAALAARGALAARFRFTNLYDMRQDVLGRLRYGAAEGVVSNVTKAVLAVPLTAPRAWTPDAKDELVFHNAGNASVMLRPRRDVNLLVSGDGFGWNLLRATAQLVALLAFLVAFGVFLGAGLSRPVALFTAIVLLALSEMSPSVLEQYPDELEKNAADAIGLFLTRTVAQVTHPIGSLQPLSALSQDVCVERADVARTLASNLVLFPLLFAALSALVIPRKTEGDA
jgi:hypothetical protein